MEKKKQILQHLYGERSAESTIRSLLQDDALREEHQALSEVKFHLDHRVRERPDPETIDRVILEAVRARGSHSRLKTRTDRPPIWRTVQLRKLMIPAVSLAAVVVVAIGLGIFGSPDQSMDPRTLQITEDEARSTRPESLLNLSPINPDLIQQAGSVNPDPMLAWDDDGSIRHLYRRIETMRPNSALDWGAESVPLESLPADVNSLKTGFRSAGSRKN